MPGGANKTRLESSIKMLEPRLVCRPAVLRDVVKPVCSGFAGPQYYGMFAAIKADRYVSMGSTYKAGPLVRVHVEAMLAAFPVDTVQVGIGTVVPAACT